MDTYSRFTRVKYRYPKRHGIMGKIEQVAVQQPAQRLVPAQTGETQVSKVELLLRKVVLAALTMLGIGHILTNAPIALLIGHSASALPIVSQANVSAIAGRILFLMASIISAGLGGLFILGAVKFYERSQTRGFIFLGVLLGSFYLLCLGAGSTLLLSEKNLMALMLIGAPILVVVSAAAYVLPHTRFKVIGFVSGTVGGVILAHVILNLRMLNFIFPWDIPFTGPFMTLTVLESAIVVLGPLAAFTNSFGQRREHRPVAHMFTSLVALVYGVGVFIGSLVLSMSFWDLIWKSPWGGVFHNLPEWMMSTIVLWSASLVLMDIGGVLLIVSACLGFVFVAREFSQLQRQSVR